MMYELQIPIILYDNQCYLCIKFAKIMSLISRGKITIIGHYSNSGREIREKILDDSALDMFWFIDEKNAFGGRAAILPMFKKMIFGKKKAKIGTNFDNKCNQECKTVKAVFVRSASLIFNSKKIELDKSK